MNAKWVKAALTVIVLTVPAWGQIAQTRPTTRATTPLSVMLEKGIYQEETVGDLAAAAQAYRQVIAEGRTNRALVAQALYRLGLVQLKQNQPKEALDTFARLRTEYPEQKDLATKAQTQIAQARVALGQSAADLGPSVLRTSPATLADNVDPALTAITVTFDRKMNDGSWSWTGGGETFPKLTGKISYDPGRTICTLPVTLAPGKVYCIGINSPSFRNFQSADGQPAQRFMIVFATRSADGKPTSIPAEMMEMAKGVNESVGRGEPVVVKTTPTALADNVPPPLEQVTVTFDQPMMNSSWSWTGGGESFPEVTGKISYDAARTTCTLPVKLKPGNVYWIGINSPSHRNFQNRANTAARRYVILFATAGADGKPTPIPEDLSKRAKAINAQSGGPSHAGASDGQQDKTAQSAVAEAVPVAEQWLKLVDDGKYVVIQFATQFQNKQDTVETVTPMKEEDGAWKVSGSFVR